MQSNNFAAGLSGIRIFVRPDEQATFDALKADLAANLTPATPQELHVFDVVLTAAWNLRRVLDLEAELQNEANELGFAEAFFDSELGKKFDRADRYKRQYETTYRRAMSELKKLVATRCSQQSAQPAEPTVHLPAASRGEAVQAHPAPTAETPRRIVESPAAPRAA